MYVDYINLCKEWNESILAGFTLVQTLKRGNSEVEAFSYDTELKNCWFKLNRNAKNNHIQV